MSKTEQSIEKTLVVQGIVVDRPINCMYGNESGWPRYDSKFLLELKHDVSVTFKRSDPAHLKAGDTIIVKCREDNYIRTGDHVTLVEASLIKLKHRVASLGDMTISDSIYIETRKLYNESLNFSFDF
jgi:hypothetical protein